MTQDRAVNDDQQRVFNRHLNEYVERQCVRMLKTASIYGEMRILEKVNKQVDRIQPF